MGNIENKIREEVIKEIFNDTAKMFDYIENRFILDEKEKDVVIEKLNSFNNDLFNLLKEVKLA